MSRDTFKKELRKKSRVQHWTDILDVQFTAMEEMGVSPTEVVLALAGRREQRKSEQVVLEAPLGSTNHLKTKGRKQ